ncbi:MAG: 1,2-phenylacetyl-CoA epoxidase subunit PaaD [Pseudomonadota bacterium]
MVEALSLNDVWAWLAEVPDPEIPAISLVDLGVIRSVRVENGTLIVTLTPTYSGCPATSVIQMEVERALTERGVPSFRIERQLAPPWTTDWISAEGREKLERYGIAPPRPAGGPSRCPLCHSDDVERVSQFGSTPCKAQWRCRTCLEPFDYFKCI